MTFVCSADFSQASPQEVPKGRKENLLKGGGVGVQHRLISRDRPTKTGILCFWSTFFYVAALSVRI